MYQLNGLKHYRRVRRYLELIYLYGFFSREDFQRSGIGSAKDYDYVLRMIRASFPQVDELPQWHDGKKSLRVLRKYLEDGSDRLSDSYMLHAMDLADDLPDYLRLFSLLGQRQYDITALSVQLEQYATEETSSKYATTRRRTMEAVRYGYLQREGHSFTTAENLFDTWDNQALKQLYDYVCFCAATTYPRVAGSFLRRTVLRELLRRQISPPPTSVMIHRHQNSHSIFDEDTAYQLLTHIAARNQISVHYLGQPHTLCPIALRVDTNLGRWYLLSLSEGQPLLCRISHLEQIAKDSVLTAQQWADNRRLVCQAFETAGCSGALTDPKQVDVQLLFGENTAIQQRFLRELRLGEITTVDGHLHYQISINDPMELIPLLRAYLPWLRVLPGDHNLIQYLQQDLLQMKSQLLEGETHAAIQ